MYSSELTIYIVDDDTAVRESIVSLVHPMGLTTRAFASGEAFLDAVGQHDYGCVVTDLRMGGMSGVDLKTCLNDRGIELPTIVLTGYADIKVTVQAMQQGAVTLLEKPATGIELWDAIRSAIQQDEKRRDKNRALRDLRRRIHSLSEKERQVMELVVDGLPNKAVARRLDVSLRTVEARRKAVFEKIGARSLAVLVKLVLQAGSAAQRHDASVMVNA